MRCKRICRELLWLARFGEFGPSSAPHLDHLSRCAGCRDEVGFDRALVHQLRIALAARIADEEPPSRSWDVIMARALAPEASGLAALFGGRAAALVARLRTMTAVSAVALAGIIATSTQIAVTHPEAGSAETEVRRSAAGELFERQPLIPRPRTTATPVIYVPAPGPADPEVAFIISAARTSMSTAPADPEVATEEPSVESEVSIGATFPRLTPADPVGGEPAAEPEAIVAEPEIPPGEPY